MKVEDKCRIEVTGKLDEEDQHTLHLLYVPLIGKEAGELYHLFYSLGASRRPITNHLLLIQMMDVSIERLEQIRMKLEQFLLLKTYLDPRINEYLYRLFPPKSGSSFLRHEVFGRLYLRKFGKDAYDFAKLFFSKEEQDREGYVELTASFAFDEGLQESADAFIRLRPKQETAAEPALDFDYQRFLEGFQRRFPQRLQTKENLRLIAELSQVHGIDELEMRKLVNQCINPRTGVFNTELLKKKARAKGRAIEMDVKDSTDAGRTGSRPLWETDCVELFFDTDPLNLPLIHPDAYTRNTFRLFITPRDPVQLHTWGAIQASACDLQIRSNPSGYSFRLEIPAETGALLGFDVKIDDAAGNSLRETTLGSGKKLFRNRCQFSLAGERKNQ